MKSKILTISTSLLLVLLLAGTVRAQIADVPTPERQAERMTKVMTERLDLSQQQQDEVLALNTRLAQKQRELLENEELDFWDRLEKLKAITQARADELKQILDDQQYQKYHALNNRTHTKYSESG